MNRAEQYELLPEHVRADVESWMRRMESALSQVAPGLAEDAVSDLLAHLAEVAHDASDITAEELLEPLGAPDEYAGAIVEAAGGQGTSGSVGAGRVVGLPYDVRVPTAERVSSRWWNPTDPRVFVPRVFGIGWNINFGYVAVLLGIVRPDDEDNPFEHTSEQALVTALGIPVLLAVVLVVAIVLGYEDLPAEVPGQWGPDGEPNWYMPAWISVAMMLAFAIAPSAWAVVVTLRNRPKSHRTAAAAFATLFVLMSGGIWLFTWTGAGIGFPIGLIWLAVLLGAPFAMLAFLARDAIDNEMREAGVGR